jgi:hypothetical protein
MEAVAETAANVIANPNWVVVGKCTFPGGTLTPGYGWDTTDKIMTRTTPNTQDIVLKVEPTVAASLYVRVRAGKISYGASNFDIGDQLSPLLVAPSSNSWVVLIQVNTSGAVIASTYGTAAASPTAPDYGGLVTLAEVTIASGATTVTAINIKDVRNFISNPGMVSTDIMLTTNNQTVTGAKTFSTAPILPTTYGNANKMYTWYIEGTLTTGTYKSAILIVPWAGTILKVFAYIGTAPTGAAVLVDINKGTTSSNGTTIWSNQANRLTITNGATSGTQTSFNTTAVAANDILSVDLDQVGSSVAGSNLTIMLQIAF